MDIKEQRKAFDAYFKDKYPELHKDVFNEDGDDRAIIGYSFALSAWLASANREGCKLVPVEASQEMVDAVYNSTLDSDDLEGIYKAMIGACDEP